MTFHSSDLDLKMYVCGQLSPENSSLVQTHLTECQECQLRLADLALQTQRTEEERRTELRVPVDFPGRLKPLDPVTSVGPPHDVQVVEISTDGLTVRTSRFLIPKTLVQVRFKGKAVLGSVQECTKTGSEYRADIKLMENFPSS